MIEIDSSSEFAEPPGNTSEQGSGETPTAVGNMNALMLYGEAKHLDENHVQAIAQSLEK